MRLVELHPIWLERDGRRVGFTFMCPHCQKDRLTCFAEPTPYKEQLKTMHAALGLAQDDEDGWPRDWVPSNPTFGWALSNLDNFETVTVTPSIDASASGNWHGFIANGEVT